MKRPDFIARQARQPSGVLGWLIAKIMTAETKELNEATLQTLDLQPTDSVLDIGFGHGRTIQRAASLVTSGRIVGIDFSETMVNTAKRRCRTLIQNGRVQLELGDSARLPFPGASFDKIYSVHTIYFWANPMDQLREIHRVARPGGRLALGVRKKSDDAGTSNFPGSVYTFYETKQILDMLTASGFANGRIAAVTGDAHFEVLVAERS